MCPILSGPCDILEKSRSGGKTRNGKRPYPGTMALMSEGGIFQKIIPKGWEAGAFPVKKNKGKLRDVSDKLRPL